MIQSKFYFPVRIAGGATIYETLAPGVLTLPLPAANPPYGPCAILETETGEQPQGLYVMTGKQWEYGLSTVDLCRAAINGDELTLYLNPTLGVTAPVGSLVYLNGQPTGALDILASKGVWVVRKPKAGGGSGGGAVDSVNGQTGDVTINAMNLPGLAQVAKTNNYTDLSNLPAAYQLPIASAALLGGVKVLAGSKLSVTAQGEIDLKTGAAITSVVTSGAGNSLINTTANGVVTLKSLTQGTGVTIVDDGAGNLTVSSAGASYTLPAATASVLGGVKVGSGLAVTADGTLSVTSVAAPVTLTGDVTGSGTGTISTTLANSGVTAGVYGKLTVNAKGIVTDGAALAAADINTALGYTPYNGATNPSGFLTANAASTFTGDVTGTGTGTIELTLSNTGVSAGTYKSLTVDAKGRVTGGTNPTTLAGYGITDALSSAGGSLTGLLTLSGAGKLTGLPTATQPGDAVNFQQLQDAVAAALTVGTWKAAAQAATTANLAALTGLLVVDTYQTVAGDRVLVKDQTTASQNGVYVAAAGAWTRATDVDTGAEIFGAAILVLMGTVNKFSQWVNSNSTAPVVGTDPITFSQLATAGQAYSAGAGLTLNGSNQFSITATGVTAGTYSKLTVNTLGQVTVGAQLASADITTALGFTPYNGTTNPNGYITAVPATTLTGDVTGSGTGSFATALSVTGVTPGTYSSLTVDAKGRVTAGSTLGNAAIVAALGFTPVNRAGDTMQGALNYAATVSVASAATTNIGTAATSNSVAVTGSVAITSFGPGTSGMIRHVIFAAALTLTQNATSLQLPTAANIAVAAGDTAVFISQGGTNWKCLSYQRADGSALLAGGGADPSKLPLAGGTMSGAFNEAPPVTIASAASVAIGAAAANTVNISGTVTITSFDTIAAGAERTLIFGGILTLTNSAALALPGAANITTAAGDVAVVLSLGGGNWKCLDYMRASGAPVVVANTFTATQRYVGSVTAPAVQIANAVELAALIAAAPAATQNFYYASGAVQFHTVAATANWVLNFAFSASQPLNTAMAVGDSMTCAMMTTQGATPFLPSSFAIDGTAVVPKWQGGTAPTAGNANAIDVYTFTIIKTGAAAYTVLAAQTQYK